MCNDVSTNSSNIISLKHHYDDGGCYHQNASYATSRYVLLDNKMDNKKLNNVNIYRFQFDDAFIQELFRFSKIHEYDDRKTFKDAWNTWLEENEDMVNIEIRRLTQLGYEGDILDKMFKSARYYFRKKNNQKKEQTTRRVYIGLQRELLDCMDNYIKSNMHVKPSDSFDIFCKEHINLLKEEIIELFRCNITDIHEIRNKIKKTYKNRYFLVISKNK